MSHTAQRRRNLLLRLQGGARFTANEAAADFEVNERTIRRDIEALRNLERFPIEGDCSGFWMRKPSSAEASTTDLRLFGMLFLAGGFIDSRYGTLDSGMGLQLRKLLLEQSETALNDLVPEHQMVRLNHPETTEDDLERVGLLGQSILSRGAVSFDYRNLGSESDVLREVLPLQIRENDGLWYLIGYCYYSKERRSYHLSRIQNLTSIFEKRENPSEKQISKWAEEKEEGVWLPTDSEEEVTVELKLTGYAREHVRKRAILKTQKIVSDDGEVSVVEIRMRGLTDLMLWIRRFGPHVEVLKPQWFRGNCVADLKDALAHYSEGGNS